MPATAAALARRQARRVGGTLCTRRRLSGGPS
eukprot:COSAG06_NODE_66957_length_253_cov_0.668831_1_plen_31_part_10